MMSLKPPSEKEVVVVFWVCHVLMFAVAIGGMWLAITAQ